MSNENITYLTDTVLITAIVPVGQADIMIKAARDLGASGAIVHHARGTGMRERLGILSIAIEADKEVLYLTVAAEHQDLIATGIYHAGRLDHPGRGFLYITPLEKMAMFIPADALDRMAGRQ